MGETTLLLLPLLTVLSACVTAPIVWMPIGNLQQDSLEVSTFPKPWIQRSVHTGFISNGFLVLRTCPVGKKVETIRDQTSCTRAAAHFAQRVCSRRCKQAAQALC